MGSEQAGPHRPAHPTATRPQRVVHDLLEVFLVLLCTNQRDLEFGDLSTETAERRFGASDGVTGSEEFVPEVDIALLGRSHELPQPVDLDTEGSWVVGGRVPGHRR